MGDGICVGRRFVGIDLHLHRSVVAGLDEAGDQLGWVRIDNDPKALVAEVRKAGGRGCAVAIEATYAPGPVDDDLPDHDAETMDRLFSRPMPDWSDRAAVAAFASGSAEILGDDPAAACATAERIWHRTPGTEPAVQMANQMGTLFSKLDCTPRWRERLPELTTPTLVVHGRRDPFFPVGNGEALAHEIPAAGLLVLEQAATAIPDAAAGEVAAAMLQL
jgi:pimeloyl-ACP methyl ester carboxylesterase